MAKGSVVQYRGKRGIVWRIKYVDAGGKQVMETVGAERDGIDKKAAVELLERRRVEVRDGLRRPEVVSFAKAADQWYGAERIAKGWKPGTSSQYRHWADDLIAYFRCPVAAITQRRCIEFRDWALREASYSSPASVNSRLTVLRMILAWARKNEYRQDVPTMEYAKVRQRKGVALKPEQVQAVLRSFDDDQARAIFVTFVMTGLRSSELRSLRWRDLSLTECRLRVEDSKTEAGERSIALSPLLVAALERHYQQTAFKGDGEYVFCHPELGSRFRMDRFGKALRRAFKTAGLTFPEGFRRCHDLRVTGATNDALIGMHPSKMLNKFGWTDPRVAQRYINLAGVVFQDEAEALERRLLGGSMDTQAVPDALAPSPSNPTPG